MSKHLKVVRIGVIMGIVITRIRSKKLKKIPDKRKTSEVVPSLPTSNGKKLNESLLPLLALAFLATLSVHGQSW